MKGHVRATLFLMCTGFPFSCCSFQNNTQTSCCACSVFFFFTLKRSALIPWRRARNAWLGDFSFQEEITVPLQHSNSKKGSIKRFSQPLTWTGVTFQDSICVAWCITPNRQRGYVTASLCVFVLLAKALNRLQWKFQEMLIMRQGIDKFLQLSKSLSGSRNILNHSVSL